MTTIKFKKPFLNQDGSINTTHDDLITPGVYIVGVKILVSDPPQYDEKGNKLDNAVEKFCPLYVGIRDNLKVRITGHRKRDSSRGELNYNKELFDLNIKGKANKLYESINNLLSMRDSITNNHTPNSKSRTPDFPILCHKCAEELRMFHKLLKDKNLLIWFPNPAFFNLKINKETETFCSNYEYHHSGSYKHKWSLDYDLKHPDAEDLAKKINKTKEIIETNFWYAYYRFQPKEFNLQENADYKTDIKPILEKIESTTKWKLWHTLGIPTYAGINGAGMQIWNNFDQGQNVNIDINLFAIKDDLVNMTGQPFYITQNDQGERVFII